MSVFIFFIAKLHRKTIVESIVFTFGMQTIVFEYAHFVWYWKYYVNICYVI